MRKISLLFLTLISLCGCNRTTKTDYSNQEPKYTTVETYTPVVYGFDEYMRCHIVWYERNEDGYTGVEKEWTVYLTGFYYEKMNYYHILKVCDNKYFYLIVAGYGN